MLQGHYTQVVVASRALVKCQLYSSSAVRPMFSRLEKTHWTTATSDCAGMSDMTTEIWRMSVMSSKLVPQPRGMPAWVVRPRCLWHKNVAAAAFAACGAVEVLYAFAFEISRWWWCWWRMLSGRGTAERPVHAVWLHCRELRRLQSGNNRWRVHGRQRFDAFLDTVTPYDALTMPSRRYGNAITTPWRRHDDDMTSLWQRWRGGRQRFTHTRQRCWPRRTNCVHVSPSFGRNSTLYHSTSTDRHAEAAHRNALGYANQRFIQKVVFL